MFREDPAISGSVATTVPQPCCAVAHCGGQPLIFHSAKSQSAAAPTHSSVVTSILLSDGSTGEVAVQCALCTVGGVQCVQCVHIRLCDDSDQRDGSGDHCCYQLADWPGLDHT